ncbi:RNA-directed DNA polymerase from mobile element jockey [Trichonephila clavipes]|nr:RNA-directed DNA polymerase from mobile element jockey [Trichonephila clavipes]
MGGRRSPRYNCSFYIFPVYRKRASKEFGVCLRSTDSMAGKAVYLRSLLANQSGRIYRQNFEADVFRSGNGGVIDPPFQLTLFDDNIQWVSVVKYLGLHIDSRLTFKKHIDYLAEKFWGRIHLGISLIGRRSPLSLENKIILYKQILHSVITYGSPVWGAAATTHMKKIQVIQNKILRFMTNAPWYVRNDVIHNDLHMEPISNYITKLSRNVFKSIESHDYPIIKAHTLFTADVLVTSARGRGVIVYCLTSEKRLPPDRQS